MNTVGTAIGRPPNAQEAPMSKLSLTPIDGGNWRIPLSVREDQRHYVSDTANILARAYALREARSVALHIALDDEPIGMLMYYDWDDGEG